MIFYLKEEFLSFDHFDIWDENENLVYSADREFFNFGKKLIVQDASGRQAAAVQHVPFSLPCTYALTIGGREYDLTRNFAFFSRSYSLDELGWEIEGDFMSLDYEITQNGRRVAAISRAFLTLGDRYALEVFDPQDALIALCTVLAIDCCDEEHSRYRTRAHPLKGSSSYHAGHDTRSFFRAARERLIVCVPGSRLR